LTVSELFRFPHTPHLAWLGNGTPRDDRVLSPAEAAELLSGPVVVEEKLDGANLGFSVSAQGVLLAQNRGHYLSDRHTGQFSRLRQWLAVHEDRLFDALGGDLIAFGEWCAARHSLDYSTLPDWWLLFDVFDRRAGRFWCAARRNAWAANLGLCTAPELFSGRIEIRGLESLLRSQRSAFRDGAMEGVVVRREDASWLLARTKLVRRDFSQAIVTHWRRSALVWNQLSAARMHG